MTHLNIDILMLIIDNVDNHHTLFSLLTVSKQVFRYTCQRLYRDPGYHLKKTANSATSSFIKMVLALSPATDESTNLLRKIFYVQQADSPPMADYLSYIRVMRGWDQLGQYLRDRLNGSRVYADSVPPPPFGSYDSFMTSVLIMATCQAGNMRELEIDFASMEYYISKASEFPRLERIFISELSTRVHRRPSIEAYPPVIRLVKAIQHHHGPNSLRDCRLASNADHDLFDGNFPLVIELDSLLPVPRSQKGIVIEPPRPLDRYLSQLEKLYIRNIYRRFWSRLSQYYAGLTPGHILQRCRELTSLAIDNDVLTLDANVLAWAAQEARDRAVGKRMPPAVPLELLSLEAREIDPVDALMIVRDALVGFSKTLSDLFVILPGLKKSCPSDGDGNIDDDPPLPRLADSELSEMLRLRRIHLVVPDFRLFDPHLLLLISPKLKKLNLDVENAIPAGSPVQLRSLASHIHLVHLCLKGACVNAFDPTELANMVNLEELVLEQAPENPTPELSARMNRWTWDWHLPKLEKFNVRSAVEGWFSLRILRTCPRLTRLDIDTKRKELLEVASVLDDPRPDYFARVSNLTISGAWDITPTDLVYLLHQVFPGLRIMYDLAKFDSCTVRQVVEATRHHPVLEQAIFPEDLLSLEDSIGIGLREVPAAEKPLLMSRSRTGCLYIFDYSTYYVWGDDDA